MTQPKKKRPTKGRPKGERPPRKIIVTFKGYEEFDDWIKELSEAVRLPVAVLIEHALIDYAKAHGFDKRAPQR